MPDFKSWLRDWWKGEVRRSVYREGSSHLHTSEDERMVELAALIESGDMRAEKLERIADLMGQSNPKDIS